MGQHNWPGLQYVMDDDDTWDWGDDNSAVGCLKGDTKTCIDTNFTQTEWDVCGAACNTTDESIYKKYMREYGTTSSAGTASSRCASGRRSSTCRGCATARSSRRSRSRPRTTC